MEFEANWCSACKHLHPLIVQAAQKLPDLVFAKVNIDTLAKVGQQYKILGVPSLLFFKDGKELSDSRLVGPEAATVDELLLEIDKYLKKSTAG